MSAHQKNKDKKMINYTKREHARVLIQKELEKPHKIVYQRGGVDWNFVEYLKEKYNL